MTADRRTSIFGSGPAEADGENPDSQSQLPQADTWGALRTRLRTEIPVQEQRPRLRWLVPALTIAVITLGGILAVTSRDSWEPLLRDALAKLQHSDQAPTKPTFGPEPPPLVKKTHHKGDKHETPADTDAKVQPAPPPANVRTEVVEGGHRRVLVPPKPPVVRIPVPQPNGSSPADTTPLKVAVAAPGPPTSVRVRIAEADSQQLLASQVLASPQQPALVRDGHVTNSVRLAVVIDKEGHVTSTRFVSGPRELSEAAMNAVRRWTYHPYVRDGVPVEMETEVSVKFTMSIE